jgi:hypothetical protein
MTPEYVAQMAPMLVLAGLAVGWGAEAAHRARGHGFLVDLAVAVGGSLVGGGIAAVTSTTGSMLAMFGIGCATAVLAIVAQRAAWPSTGPPI